MPWKLFDLDLDLLRRVGRRIIQPGSLSEVNKVRAVEGEIVVHRAPAVNRHAGPARVLLFISCGANTVVTPGRIPASPNMLRPLSGRSCTRRSSTVVDQPGESLIGGIHQRGRTGDGDLRLYGAHLQDRVTACGKNGNTADPSFHGHSTLHPVAGNGLGGLLSRGS